MARARIFSVAVKFHPQKECFSGTKFYSAQDMWLFSARISTEGDSARVLVLFPARILFVAGLERDFKCFTARIAAAGESARELGMFFRSKCVSK